MLTTVFCVLTIFLSIAFSTKIFTLVTVKKAFSIINFLEICQEVPIEKFMAFVNLFARQSINFLLLLYHKSPCNSIALQFINFPLAVNWRKIEKFKVSFLFFVVTKLSFRAEKTQNKPTFCYGRRGMWGTWGWKVLCQLNYVFKCKYFETA